MLRSVLFNMHYVIPQTPSTLNKYVRFIIHVLLMLLPLMWNSFELFFVFLDSKVTLKLPLKKVSNVCVKN